MNSRDAALQIFQLQEEQDGEGADSDSERYMVSIRNKLRFELIVKCVGAGVSLQQCCRVINDAKKTASLVQIENSNMGKVIATVRHICGMAFQMISDTLNSLWAFSIVLDGVTKNDLSYLDVGLRFSIKQTIHSFHLVAIPMRESHTGDFIFGLLSDFLNVLCPKWKTKLIGISSDGSCNKSGKVSSIVSHLHKASDPGCFRVSCGAHQIDSLIQKAFKQLCDDVFVSTVIGVTGHLRRQRNLISKMRSKFPRFVDTRWLSMEIILEWFVKNKILLVAYFEETNLPCPPNASFWIAVHVLHDLSTCQNSVSSVCRGFQRL